MIESGRMRRAQRAVQALVGLRRGTLGQAGSHLASSWTATLSPEADHMSIVVPRALFVRGFAAAGGASAHAFSRKFGAAERNAHSDSTHLSCFGHRASEQAHVCACLLRNDSKLWLPRRRRLQLVTQAREEGYRAAGHPRRRNGVAHEAGGLLISPALMHRRRRMSQGGVL